MGDVATRLVATRTVTEDRYAGIHMVLLTVEYL